MAEMLANIKGHFILSLNAVPGVYETFKDFNFEEVDCTYSIASSETKAVKEVLITPKAK